MYVNIDKKKMLVILSIFTVVMTGITSVGGLSTNIATIDVSGSNISRTSMNDPPNHFDLRHVAGAPYSYVSMVKDQRIIWHLLDLWSNGCYGK